MNWSGWLRYEWARALAVLAAVVGVVLLVVGWVGVSGSSLTSEQIPYLASGAIGGLFALGVGATLWLSADLRDEFVKLDEIYRWLQGDDGEATFSSYEAGVEPDPVVGEYAVPVSRRRLSRERPASRPEPGARRG